MIYELQPEGLCSLWNGPWQANCIPIHDCVHWSPPPSSDPAWHKHKSFYQRQFLTSVWSFEKDNLKTGFPQILSWGASHFLRREGINHGSPSMTESPPAYPLNPKPTFINLQINTPRAWQTPSPAFHSLFFWILLVLFFNVGDSCHFPDNPFLVSIWLGLFSIRGSFDCAPRFFLKASPSPGSSLPFPLSRRAREKMFVKPRWTAVAFKHDPSGLGFLII